MELTEEQYLQHVRKKFVVWELHDKVWINHFLLFRWTLKHVVAVENFIQNDFPSKLERKNNTSLWLKWRESNRVHTNNELVKLLCLVETKAW